MSAALHIRPYVEADADAVIALWQACELTRPWNDPHKDIVRKLHVQRELFLVGTLDGRIVASVMAGYEGHRGWVNYLAVHPDCQRRQFGRALMDAVQEQLLALGCPKINLQVRGTNTQALGFYRSLGYAVEDVVSMGRRLIADGHGH